MCAFGRDRSLLLVIVDAFSPPPICESQQQLSIRWISSSWKHKKWSRASGLIETVTCIVIRDRLLAQRTAKLKTIHNPCECKCRCAHQVNPDRQRDVCFTSRSDIHRWEQHVRYGPIAPTLTSCLRVARFTSNCKHYISTMPHSRSRTSVGIRLQDQPCLNTDGPQKS